MAKVILICGRLCCGKSTYAEKLVREHGGIILSVDEIMLAMFGQNAGSEHDRYTKRLQAYLLDKSVEILEAGCDVILDWGFWTREARCFAKEFYENRGIQWAFHYLDVEEGVRKQRIEKRNREVSVKGEQAYLVDEGLAVKAEALFEPPEQGEMQVWVKE